MRLIFFYALVCLNEFGNLKIFSRLNSEKHEQNGLKTRLLTLYRCKLKLYNVIKTKM